MTWEVFERGQPPRGSPASLSILKRGDLGLNRAAYGALGSPKSVLLLFDTESGRIAIRPADAGDRNSYPVRAQREGRSGFRVAARAFFNHHGIDFSRGRRFPAALEGDMLVIDLEAVELGGFVTTQ